ncbi:MAG TPA: recombinase RecT [Puia sp.]|jgi:recombinational DNA repair protein RecT|nr:recombinase RecT [Puia sp.]
MSNVTNSQNSITQVLANTPPAAIGELDFVRDRYIRNYNACHREKVGDMMYHRNVIHFKQILSASEKLRNCDPFSLYAVFATAAVNGYSLDPADDEVYIVPRGGKAVLQRQAGAYIRKLKRSGQILSADKPVLVYQGDIYQVEKGRVLRHQENFQTDIIIAGYIRFELDENGRDLFATFRKSDWESWRQKSEMKDGPNWNHNGSQQPQPEFLKTKITLHACKAKHWAIGTTPANVEQFTDVEMDVDDESPSGAPVRPEVIANSTKPFSPENASPTAQQPAAVVPSHSAHESKLNGRTVSFDDDPDQPY